MKNPTLGFLILFAGVLAHAQAGTKQPMIPNMYEFSGGAMHINYTTTSIDGQPRFTYKDGSQTLNFSGSQIRTAKTELGTLVTVSIRMPVDAGPTTFTLLLPTVNLAEPSSRVQIHTYGITTIHRFFLGTAAKNDQTETYTATELSGNASLAVF